MVKKIFKFSAQWCGPCRLMEQIFHQVESNPKYSSLIFQNYDVDDDTNDKLIHKYKIKNIPVIIIVGENEEEIERITGVTTIDSITSAIDRNLH